MEDKLVEIKLPIQLLVEGKDGQKFFEAFRDRLGLSRMQIHDYGGVSELRRFLSAFVKASRFRDVVRIGIVRDAEKSADSAFQSVQSALSNANLPVPVKIGNLFTEGYPHTSVLILPEQGFGMLETVLNQSFAGTPVDICIDGFLDCIESTTGEAIHRPDKARANAYLSSQKEPHVPVGIAARKGYWNLDHEAFRPIRHFMQGLCAA